MAVRSNKAAQDWGRIHTHHRLKGWPRLLRPAGSCTTHEESSISSIGSIGPDREMGVRRGNGILSLFPNPWRINLNIDENLETRNAWQMKEICLIKMETMKNQLETFKGLFLGVNWYSRSHAGGRRLHGIYSSRWGYTSGQLSSGTAGQGSQEAVLDKSRGNHVGPSRINSRLYIL